MSNRDPFDAKGTPPVTKEQVEQYFKPRITDAVKRKHNRVWVGTFTEQDKEYEVFVTVEERK